MHFAPLGNEARNWEENIDGQPFLFFLLILYALEFRNAFLDLLALTLLVT
jgi:hypothetical protein